jgi:uncharacterized membrane protein YGL010W
MTMRKIDLLLAEYGESHQNSTNKTIHWICVPLIFFSIIGLIASIPAYPIQLLLSDSSPYANWATVVFILAIAYYLSLSVPLAIGMALFGIFCLMLVRVISMINLPLWLVSLIIFTVGWIGQFYGHKIEGKKPSFLKDIQFLLIGPAWLMHFLYKCLGIPY